MAAGEASGPTLVVTSPADLAGKVLPLSEPELVIGHSDTADLVLEDGFVSPRHALVTVDESRQVTIRDLNSTGGTFINGEWLARPRVLRDGDLVQFADLVARFEPGNPAYDIKIAEGMQKIDPTGVLPSVVEAEITKPGPTNVKLITAWRGQIVVTVIPR